MFGSALGHSLPADMTGTESKGQFLGSLLNRTQPSKPNLLILRVAPVYRWRAEAGDGGGDSESGGRRCASCICPITTGCQGMPDTDIFVGYSLRAGTIEDAQKIEVEYIRPRPAWRN